MVSHMTSMCLSVRPSVFFSEWYNGFSPNLVCELVLWRSSLGLLMGKLRQFFTLVSLSAPT